MIDKNKTWVTRRERCPVRIYCTDAGGTFPVHGAFLRDGIWNCYSWKENGSHILVSESGLDLIEVKPRHKRKVWFRFYSDGAYSTHGSKPFIREKAIAIVEVEVEFEEGEGLK